MAKKPWGGRFTQETNALTEVFTASISFDKRLYRYDITGSMAYCEALAKAGIISTNEKGKILQALKEIEGEIEKGEFQPHFSEMLYVIASTLLPPQLWPCWLSRPPFQYAPQPRAWLPSPS